MSWRRFFSDASVLAHEPLHIATFVRDVAPVSAPLQRRRSPVPRLARPFLSPIATNAAAKQYEERNRRVAQVVVVRSTLCYCTDRRAPQRFGPLLKRQNGGPRCEVKVQVNDQREYPQSVKRTFW